MIYFCADDYGLLPLVSSHIQNCVDEGALNKVSVFPNFDTVDLKEIFKNKGIRVSLHLNLVEGKCMADPGEIDLLADENGVLRHTFEGLLKLSLLNKKTFETQLYKEIKTQVLFWKSILPDGEPFCVDSHQHTHMIPAIFKTLISVLKDEKINVDYLRIPAEPILPFIKKPSLYFTYSCINLIKQWLLKLFWVIDKKYLRGFHVPTAYFLGILFSGKMDEKRVTRVLAEYVKKAKKDGRDIEVLFHPGYADKNVKDLKSKNIVFEKFYLSENRKTEFDSVMKISMKEVCDNALY